MKQLILTIFFSKITFFLITTISILSLNLTPLVMQIRHTPPGRTFALNHNNSQDFFFYQALMNEGANGNTLIYDPYTTEPHQPSIIFAYFLWLGKLSKLFNLSYAVTYHLVRVIASIIFLTFVFFFLHKIKIPYPNLTYLFFLYASPLMNKFTQNGGELISPYMYWWTGMDAIRRAAYLPHHAIGSFLLVLSLYLLIKFFLGRHIKSVFYASFVAILLAFIHTPSLFILLIIIPTTIFLYFVLNLKKSADNSQILSPVKFRYILIYIITALSALVLMVTQTNRGFPWNQYISWEKELQFPLNRELWGALGILFPLTVVGAVNSIVSKRFINILYAAWLFIPILLIPFATSLNISNIRLIQGAPYLAQAILASIGVRVLIQFGTRFVWLPKKLLTFFPVIIVFILIIFSYKTYVWSVNDQIKEYWPIFGNVYFDNRLFSAFKFINANFPAKTYTLSTFYTGNYLPVFTNTISFIGHSGYTYNVDSKQLQVGLFFGNKMSSDEAKKLILNNKIKLIFQGPEEKPIYKSYLYPDLLKVIYDTEEVTLYIPISTYIST